jgi:hypothetical protein
VVLLAACGSSAQPPTVVGNAGSATPTDASVASTEPCEHIEGFISDPATGRALIGAHVSAYGGPAAGEVTTRTDDEGHFTLPYRGDYDLLVIAPGLREVLAINPDRCNHGTLYASPTVGP